MVEAQVLTFRNVVDHDEKREHVSSLVVAGQKARFTDEIDRWRLFLIDRSEVVFVDDVRQTFETKSLQALIREKQLLGREATPSLVPRVVLARGGAGETILGYETTEYAVEMGNYRRELLVSTRPLIDERFFALAILSEPLGGPHRAPAASLHRSLAGLTGYPVVDRTTFSFGNRRWQSERRLEKIEKKRVPQSLLEIPSNYRDVTPKAPAAGRPGAASPPSGRSTRATE